MAQQSLVGQGLLFIEGSRSLSDTTHSVGFLCTNDQPDVETSTWQKTRTRDKHSNPQSQKRGAAGPRLRPSGHQDRHWIES